MFLSSLLPTSAYSRAGAGRGGFLRKGRKCIFHLAGAVCSSFFANAGQHCHGKHPGGGLSRSTFVGFLGRPSENVRAEFVSNLEVHLLRVQRSDCGVESLKLRRLNQLLLELDCKLT